MRRRIILTLILTFGLAGCGALFNGGPAKVAFNSEPSGADVIINGNRYGQTPLVVDLSKQESHTISFRMDGYEEVVRTLNHKVSGTYVVLDVLGGLLPVVVDAATGSWYVLESDNVNVSMARQAGESARSGMSGQLDAVQLEMVQRGVRPAVFVEKALRAEEDRDAP